jgi:hypothetical protein
MLSIPSLIERHIPYQSTSLVEQTPYSLVMDQSAAIPFDKALVDYLDAMETNPEAGKLQSLLWSIIQQHVVYKSFYFE